MTAAIRPCAHAAVAALVAALAAMVLAPPAADAAADRGKVSLTLKRSAAKSLKSSGVKVGTRGAAKRRKSKISLPVSRVAVGKSAAIRLGGALRFRAGKRVAALKGIRVRLRGKKVSLSAKIGKRRVTVLAGKVRKGRAKLNSKADSARLKKAAVRWTRKGSRTVKRRLGGKRVTGTLGTLRIRAHDKPGGNSDGGGPQLTPITSEPPLLKRPATAIDIASATLRWNVRDSFIRYINSGEGTSTSGGATPGPAEVRSGSSTPLVYTFHFPFTNGWYDPPSQTAAIYHRGTVTFKYTAHGIDLDTKGPEIEINGSRSRSIFRFAGRQQTNPGNKRAVLVNLHPGSRTVSGKTFDYGEIPGTIPKDTGANLFAGFYSEGDPFGSMRVTFTTR